MKIGFVYQCYNQDYALFHCLKGVRENYPTEPIYLMCDNGNDYSQVAKHFNCHYVHFDDHVDVHFDADQPSREVIIERYRKYLLRMKAAFEYMNVDYIMRLEDDVKVTGRIWHIPKFDLVCPFNVYASFSGNSVKYLNYVHGTTIGKESDRIFNFGCGGGSLIKRTSFLEYIDTILNDLTIIDFFYGIDSRNLVTPDIADGFGMLFFGYTSGRSFSIADINDSLDTLSIKDQNVVYHRYKDLYDIPCDLTQLMKEHKSQIF